MNNGPWYTYHCGVCGAGSWSAEFVSLCTQEVFDKLKAAVDDKNLETEIRRLMRVSCDAGPPIMPGFDASWARSRITEAK